MRGPITSLNARPTARAKLGLARAVALPDQTLSYWCVEVFAHHQCAIAGVAQLVERQLPKLDVAGSNPVSRSLDQKILDCTTHKRASTDARLCVREIVAW